MTQKRVASLIADSFTRARTTPRTPEPPRVSPTRIIDGRLAVDVTLRGSRGEGCSMTLDEWQWGRVKAVLGDQWGLKVVKGHRYVVARGVGAGIRLARWITGAQGGQVVSYRNGNSLDLRGANLAVVDGGEFLAGVFGHLSALAAEARDG